MIRTIASAAALALALCVAAQAAPAPQPPRGRQLEYEAAERGFARVGPVEPMAELFERWQYDGQKPYRSAMLGAYGRVERHLKLGAFWKLQYGARHDDDWRRTPQAAWLWRDTSRRPENLFVLDATPRAELSWLPGHWTASFKARYEHNLFDGQQVLELQPELAWFWLDGLRPRATVFLRHGTDLALNFGEALVWRRWWYLAALWHAGPVSFGPQAALRDETWSASRDFQKFSPGADYKVLYRSVVVGATLVARWQ